MAYKLNLSTSLQGMSHIWNISAHVGDQPSSTNSSTDVDLVALLLGGFIRSFEAGDGIHPSCRQPFQVNGNMDVNIAYWIRIINAQHKEKLSLKEAGIISPARKTRYVKDTWSIVKLNMAMFKHMRSVWEDFPNHPQCPVALRNELLTKTNP